jgi:hypothetical protein
VAAPPADREAVEVSGVAAVQQRIAEIQSRVAPLQGSGGVGRAADFASTLTSATETLGASGTTGAKATAPAEFARYGNGRIPSSALSEIGVGQHRLWGPAAESFKQLMQAAARDGVRVGVTDSYRSYDEQVDLARRKGLYSQGGLAATPGTSNHGWGLSLDLDLDDRAQAWMRANGARFGFTEDVPREPWHWTYTRSNAPAATVEPRPAGLAR